MSADKRLAILAFGVGIAYWPGLAAAFFMPRWWLIAIGLPLISCLDPRAVYRPALWCMLAGLAWGAASVFWMPHPHAAALDLYFLSLLCLTGIAAANVEDLAPAIAALGGGVAVSSILVGLQAIGWHPVPQSPTDPAGLFLNSEVLAELAAVLLVWALIEKRWLLAALLAAGNLPVAHHSRIAILVVLVGLIYGWRPESRRMKAITVSCLSIALVAAVIVGIAAASEWKLSSAAMRIGLWFTAILSLDPIGHGLGWWAAAHPFPYEDMAHSDVLQAGVEIGLGALFFVAIAIMIFVRRAGTIATRAAFLGICIEALVSFPLHLPASSFLAALLAGHLSRDRRAVRVARSQRRAGFSPYLRRPNAYGGWMD